MPDLSALTPEAIRELATDARRFAHQAVTEGVDLKYVDRMRQKLYAAAAALESSAEESERQRNEALGAMWQCVVATGADTDGDSRFHCTFEQACSRTVYEVTDLRRAYDDACEEAYMARLHRKGLLP